MLTLSAVPYHGLGGGGVEESVRHRRAGRLLGGLFHLPRVVFVRRTEQKNGKPASQSWNPTHDKERRACTNGLGVGCSYSATVR